MKQTEQEKDIARYTIYSNKDYYTIEKRGNKFYVMLTEPGKEPSNAGVASDSLKEAKKEFKMIHDLFTRKLNEAISGGEVVWSGKDSN